MSESAISVQNLHKTYRVYARPADRLIEALFRRPRHQAFHALSDVSFEISRGAGLAIIGENGAGKSTLLKILAGVTALTSGTIQVQRPLASILELGSAFHPEFTGRQNIALNAAMMGLQKDEIDACTPAILAFSELGSFIDQPLKTYSTGMAMRLAFAIATQVEPEVLIVDEALSVGDGYFQKKCMDHITGFIASGRTILFCSHAMYYVSALCQTALWLRNGRVEDFGPVEQVVRAYENFLLTKSEGESASGVEETKSPEKLVPTRILEVNLVRGTTYRYGEPLEVEVVWRSQDPELKVHLGVSIDRPDGVTISSFLSRNSDVGPWSGSGNQKVRFEILELPLAKGSFRLNVFLTAEDCLHVYETKTLHEAFCIEGEDYTFGVVHIPHRWISSPDLV
ncbi:MAG: ABC transporter ATP-binding protein [Thermoanaerobaculales bacterium]|nr:ABC transporter ATP-binding protein [Thermoanaerobaculales bacterium]